MDASKILDSAYRTVAASGSTPNIEVAQMPGDASTRKYFRVSEKSQPKNHFIMMSTEAFNASEYNFLLIQDLLHRNGVPVPEVKAVQEKDGTILLSDLGDATMLHCLEASMEESVEIAMFRRAIDLMLQIHAIEKDDNTPASLSAFEKSFDEELLMWEVNFTIEHFLTNYLERKIPEVELQGIRESFQDICQRLAGEPRVFTHRDYHTRNIMVTNDDVYHSIDFQDARMGPRQYDLASLLRDSYYQMKEEKVYGLLRYYFDSVTEKGILTEDWESFSKTFDLMSIQRNFKAIGSFASFYIRRDNAKYLRFIGNTFENVRRNLVKFPEYKELHQLLFNWYYF